MNGLKSTLCERARIRTIKEKKRMHQLPVRASKLLSYRRPVGVNVA